ncbi:bifunctional acetaldehyde-CoA/alcohol dehydrogenase [Lactobacillus sp.]|uniref:bifunctional acetaldehyde-CoA/alcohol dehydrogenase n=1 Tax=Lactobacillus sp. TaxID=1591 RepID=UPI0019C881AA|nr:bifunctional acetaldehyde-CoA/alcohol dehydrogenase [Lactobacillus sp.]MBD5429560.1 bifunctional acetaldehyde-CoA/alcohol dehydrogenase [Lactobacillus sp.]
MVQGNKVEKPKNIDTDKMINSYVKKAHQALNEMANFSQEQVDKICEAVASAAEQNSYGLAEMAVEETGRGIVEDKAIKNMFASENIWNSLRNQKTVGVIKEDRQNDLIKIAEPKGVIAGVTPVTNPTSTVIFKSLLALKTRNAIIFGFHPQAQKSCVKTAEIIRAAAVAAGAPMNAIQWIEQPSLEATSKLMNHQNVQTILATGGPGMVKAAYSSGKPAIGVGPGNGPTYIEKTADILEAVNDIVLSKTFDNGMICSSENSVVVDKEIYEEVKEEFRKWKCYFLTPDEVKKFEQKFIDPKRGTVAGPIAGRSAYQIAKLCDVDIPKDIKVIIAEYKGVGKEFPLSAEKLSPVFTLYKSNSHEEAYKICTDLLNYGGRGHTAGIHSQDTEVIEDFSMKMDACRILVNSPASVGGVGDLYNNMLPSLTLGTGSYGANTFSHNIGAMDLLNIKTVGMRRNNVQSIKVPGQIYFEHNAINSLQQLPDIKKFFIVTNEELGASWTDKIINILGQRRMGYYYEVFNNISSSPTTDIIREGIQRMNAFKPDAIIALGDDSVMNASKAMRLFYENPQMTFEKATQKFMDGSKRTVVFPENNKIKLIAIPTTSTGSEVSPFSIITNSKDNVRDTICSDSLIPDIVILDNQFVEKLPQKSIALYGFETLSHALESYVSTMATDFTRAWSMKAIKLVFNNLEKAYNGDYLARVRMQNAATLAGMASANAFLGVGEAIAQTEEKSFNIPVGLIDATLIPYVIKFNSKRPEKLALCPRYSVYRADKDYIEIAQALNLKGNSNEELINELIKEIVSLSHKVGIKPGLKFNGVKEVEFNAIVKDLALEAYKNQNIGTNPSRLLVSEIIRLVQQTYNGTEIEKD